MAEAIELDLTVDKPSGQTENKSINPIISTIPKNKSDNSKKIYNREVYYQDDELGSDVLGNKYLAPWGKHPFELWERQAKAIASVEKTKSLRIKWEKNLFSILKKFQFCAWWEDYAWCWKEDITTTLNNCYVVAVKDDSVKSIYNTIINEALTYKYGGGCGHDLSVLRPSGEAINGTGGESCGPTGFMNLFKGKNTNTIAQHGRRGANMQTLRIDHPDIEKFISIKTGDIDMIKYSNISVLLTHEFMDAVKQDKNFDLKYEKSLSNPKG